MLSSYTMIDTIFGPFYINRVLYGFGVYAPNGIVYVRQLIRGMPHKSYRIDTDQSHIVFSNQKFYSNGEVIDGKYLRIGDVMDTKLGQSKVINIRVVIDKKPSFAIQFDRSEADFYLANGILAKSEL